MVLLDRGQVVTPRARDLATLFHQQRLVVGVVHWASFCCDSLARLPSIDGPRMAAEPTCGGSPADGLLAPAM